MMSLKLRRIVYSAAIGVDNYNLTRKKKLEKINDLEKQVLLAKKIMNSLEENREGDPAMLIRLEGKLKKIENIIKLQKQTA
jgi:hypothetical protein